MNKWAIIGMLCMFVLLQSCGKRFMGFGFGSKDELKVETFEYEYFSSRTKFKYRIGKERTRATAHIRMKKDSIIWFSLTPGVGIEGARGIITQDSLVMIDRVNKQVIRHSFESLSQEFNFELNFDLLQSMIIGEMPIKSTSKDKITKEENHYLVNQTMGDLKIDNIIGIDSRKLERLTAVENSTNNSLELRYEDFKIVDEHILPHKALVLLNYLKEGQPTEATIDIEHNRPQIEKKPLKFPFNIPKRYERR